MLQIWNVEIKDTTYFFHFQHFYKGGSVSRINIGEETLPQAGNVISHKWKVINWKTFRSDQIQDTHIL